MPHLDLRYSRNLEQAADIKALCDRLAEVMKAAGIFPLGGIRVRALACDAYAIADGHAANAFLDMELRVGVGRSEEDKRKAGEAIFAAAADALGALFDAPHFALSFEIREIDARLSWKKNSIHPRLKGTEAT
jgi:5-carboxymethyl-2-hydroxymuconate isomerase